MAGPALAAEPVTATGIDVIVGDSHAAPGQEVTVPVRFVPGPSDGAPGGPDEIASVQLTLDFSGLEFDASDVAPADGIPDAIEFNSGGDPLLDAFALIVSNADTAEDDGFLDLIVTDPTRTHSLPSATLLSVMFRVPDQSSPTTIPVRLRNVVPKDTRDSAQALDESVDGVVTVLPPTTPVVSPTATATPTPTEVVTSTPRPTRTLAPPTVTPPPGCVNFNGSLVCSHGEDGGGCAIGARTSHRGLLVMCILLFVRWRARQAHSRQNC